MRCARAIQRSFERRGLPRGLRPHGALRPAAFSRASQRSRRPACASPAPLSPLASDGVGRCSDRRVSDIANARAPRHWRTARPRASAPCIDASCNPSACASAAGQSYHTSGAASQGIGPAATSSSSTQLPCASGPHRGFFVLTEITWLHKLCLSEQRGTVWTHSRREPMPPISGDRAWWQAVCRAPEPQRHSRDLSGPQ